jgi:hypothetical protein
MKKTALFAYAEKWSSGIALHKVALGLIRYPNDPLNSLLGNAQQTELVYQICRSVTLEASNGLKTTRATAVAFIEKCRPTLKQYLGERWTTAWNQAGFTNNSLQVPRKNAADIKQLLNALQKYFQDHPTHQNAAAGVTEAATVPLLASLTASIKAVDLAESEQLKKRNSRDATHKSLSQYLRDSRKEVESAIQENDERWMDFIDSVPGELRPPEAVKTIVAEQGLPGHVRLSFLGAVRATAYGVYVSTDGGATYAHFTTIRDTVADLVLTPGAAVKIRVKASNAAGQSAFSPVAEVTVPMAAAA